MSMSVEVIYALHLKPGDLWAGLVNREAPTTPVQPFAAAHLVNTVDTITDEAGAKWQHVNRFCGLDRTYAGQGTSASASDQERGASHDLRSDAGIGRYAMRAGASRGPAGPPQQWGWVGKFWIVLILAILAVHWWRAVVFGVLPAVVFLVLVAALVGAAKGAGRKSKPDPLTEALKHESNGRRKP